MTIERQYGKIIFECDVGTSPRCEETFESDTDDFVLALREIRGTGWNSAPDGKGGWLHYCGYCPRPETGKKDFTFDRLT